MPDLSVGLPYKKAKQAILEVVSGSPVPEDPIHAENTVEWVLKLTAEADDSLLLAALGHDIERSVQSRRVHKADYPSFDDFKAAHALNSADILADLLGMVGLDEAVVRETHRLVKLHEIGGDRRSDLLRDADSLSFFQVNLPFYFERNGKEKAVFRATWGYRRLSPEHRAKINLFHYDNPRIKRLIMEITRSSNRLETVIQ